MKGRTEFQAIAIAMVSGCVAVTEPAAAQRSDTVVKWIGTPMHQGVASMVEQIRIGVLEGPPEYSFVAIADIAIGNDGSVLILDTGSSGMQPFGTPTLRLFDSAGHFIRNVGRIGDGPGEYRQPTSLTTLTDGRFLLLDRGTQRITVYSGLGIYQDSWKIPNFQVTIGLPGAMRTTARNTVTIAFTSSGSARRDTRHDERRRAVVRIGAGGNIIDTLLAPTIPVNRLQVTKGRGIYHVPYSPDALVAWNPSGYFVTGLNTKYAIDLLEPALRGTRSTERGGGRVLSIRARFTPVAVSAAERADQKALVQGRLDATEGEQSGSLPAIPRTKPFLRHIYVADDGRIWAWIHSPSVRYDPPEKRNRAGKIVPQLHWREPDVADVFESNGVYVGRVRIPDGVRTLKIRGDVLWGYSVDEFDVQYFKRYKVVWN